MYKMMRRVGYSDISGNRQVSMAQIVRYLQDTSTFHSDSVGETLEELKERGKAWLLSGWQIEVARYPKFGEELQISTWPHENKPVLAQRNFEICDSQGETLVMANSFWFYFDFQTGMPCRILPEHVECYGLEERLPMNYKGRRIAVPKDMKGTEKESFLVKKADLDTNGHVNNAKYIDMALEYVEKEEYIKEMRADYRKSALMGDRIYPVVYEETDRIIVELKSEETDFVVIEFIMDGEDKENEKN